MSIIQKIGNKKLSASLILLLLAFIPLGFAIYFFLPMYVSADDDAFIIFMIATVCYALLVGGSICVNRSYRKQNSPAGALSTILLVVSYIAIIPIVFMIVLIFYIILGLKEAFHHMKETNDSNKSVSAKDKFGNTHTLRRNSSGSYTDANGKNWKTHDGGKTFKRD